MTFLIWRIIPVFHIVVVDASKKDTPHAYNTISLFYGFLSLLKYVIKQNKTKGAKDMILNQAVQILFFYHYLE